MASQSDQKLLWSSVKLTPIHDSDAQRICEWQNTPSIRDLTMGFRFPVQLEATKDWIKSLSDQNGKTRAVFAIRVNDDIKGVVQLHHIDTFQRKGMFGIYIAEENTHNKGLGTIATTLLLDYAFNGLDLRRIALEVIADHHAAVQLYKKVGFIEEGKKRQEYYVDGEPMDVLFFGILKEEFRMIIPVDAHRLVHSFHR